MRLNTTVLLALVVTSSACDSEDKDPAPVGKGTTGTNDSDNDPPPDDSPAWAVGEQGEMLRINPDGSGASGYDLDASDDLLGIACHGADVAWAVGTRGTLLSTHDAGATWRPVAIEREVTLRAVEISESEVIFAVGDEGSMLVSRDAGESFVEVEGPDVDFTGVATNHEGTLALVTAYDGSIWRYDADAGLVHVHTTDAALYGITMTGAGDRIIAVGSDGTWLESADFGYSFSRDDIGTERDLYAVQVAHAAELALAVGEAGVVVSVDGFGALVQELLDEDTALRALHVSGDGHGITVGEAGVAFTTVDTGLRWDPIGVPTTHDLLGVDEISLHGHR